MRELAGRGVGIIFISHFLEEVLDVADWITVLRNGRVVASAPATSLRLDTMTTLMLGGQLRSQLADRPMRDERDPGGPVSLEARNLSVGERLRDISLQVRCAEIVGVAGLVGSGRSRLCRALAGADTPTTGQLLLHGKPVRLRNPQQALRAGIALIPEDRKNQGLSLASPPFRGSAASPRATAPGPCGCSSDGSSPTFAGGCLGRTVQVRAVLDRGGRRGERTHDPRVEDSVERVQSNEPGGSARGSASCSPRLGIARLRSLLLSLTCTDGHLRRQAS
jgi:energy-coupling factor transporter ATP-binding protein EcfA2